MKKTVLIAVAIAILISIIAGAALYFTGVISLNAPPGQEQSEQQPIANTPPPTPLYIPMNPAVTVSFSDDEDAQFLQLSLTVATTEKDVEEAISQHMPAIRNALVMLFASQKAADLRGREGKEKLRQEALSEINRVLEHAAGVAGINDVFFTSFVMQ